MCLHVPSLPHSFITSLNSHFSSFSPSHHSFISLKSNITQYYLATNMPAVRTRKEKAEFQPYSRKKDHEIKDQGANENVSPSLTSWDTQLTRVGSGTIEHLVSRRGHPEYPQVRRFTHSQSMSTSLEGILRSRSSLPIQQRHSQRSTSPHQDIGR